MEPGIIRTENSRQPQCNVVPVRGVVVIPFAPCPLLSRGLLPKCLTPAQIEQHREEGCFFPIRIMSETEATTLRVWLGAFERRTGGPLKGDLRHK